jgi:prepilin-type N-terminal cleavage/methylation domain-containing protein
MAPRAARRAGYTLIELLIVIAIIAVLASLLLVAISGATRRGDETKARSHLTTLDTVLGQFKSKFNNNAVPCVGGGPNGTFRLCSSYVNPSTGAPLTDPSGREWPEITILKRLFPRMELIENGLRVALPNGDPQPVFPPPTAGPITLTNVSTNLGSAGIAPRNPLLLDPNQCLVFFLTGAQFTAYSGFNSNPTQPFAWAFGPAAGPFTGQNSRLHGGAFTEFEPRQLKDPVDPADNLLEELYPAAAADKTVRWQAGTNSTPDNLSDPALAGGRVKWFVDPWGLPYLYISTKTGNNDYPITEFNIGTPAATPTNTTLGGLKIFPWGGLHTPNHNPSDPRLDGFFPFREGNYKFAQAKNHQLLSAGQDGPRMKENTFPIDLNKPYYGFGPGSPPNLPLTTPPTFRLFKAGEVDGYKETEAGADDLSNIHGQKLGSGN